MPRKVNVVIDAQQILEAVPKAQSFPLPDEWFDDLREDVSVFVLRSDIPGLCLERRAVVGNSKSLAILKCFESKLS